MGKKSVLPLTWLIFPDSPLWPGQHRWDGRPERRNPHYAFVTEPCHCILGPQSLGDALEMLFRKAKLELAQVRLSTQEDVFEKSKEVWKQRRMQRREKWRPMILITFIFEIWRSSLP